jgi:hypothetical protein
VWSRLNVANGRLSSTGVPMVVAFESRVVLLSYQASIPHLSDVGFHPRIYSVIDPMSGRPIRVPFQLYAIA